MTLVNIRVPGVNHDIEVAGRDDLVREASFSQITDAINRILPVLTPRDVRRLMVVGVDAGRGPEIVVGLRDKIKLGAADSISSLGFHDGHSREETEEANYNNEKYRRTRMKE